MLVLFGNRVSTCWSQLKPLKQANLVYSFFMFSLPCADVDCEGWVWWIWTINRTQEMLLSYNHGVWKLDQGNYYLYEYYKNTIKWSRTCISYSLPFLLSCFCVFLSLICWDKSMKAGKICKIQNFPRFVVVEEMCIVTDLVWLNQQILFMKYSD